MPGLKARSTLELGSAFGHGKFLICCPTPRHALALAERGQKDFTSAVGEVAPASTRCARGGGDTGRWDAGTLQPQLAPQGSPGTATQPRPPPANPSSSFQTGACSSAPCHVNTPGEAGGDALSRFTL